MDSAEIKRQLVGELKADKRKAALVAVLVIVAAFVAIRLAVKHFGSEAPARVSASELVPRGAGDAPAVAGGIAPPGGSGREERERDKYIRQLDRTIVRDIFEPSPVFFPVQEKRPTAQDKTGTAATNGDAQKKIREKFIREQAASLKLQTTIVGVVPTAIVNDRVLRVGDWINGFEIVEITSQTCVVRKSDVEVPLKMKK